MHQWQLAQFPKRAQDQIWGELPYVTSAGSAFPPGKAVKVDGGYRVSAHHKYCSGIMHSEWVNSFVALETDGVEKRALLCMLPIGSVTVLDTWHVDGMAATGSHDIVFKDAFVPEHLAVSVEAMRQGQFHHPHPAYRIPFALFLGLVIAVPMLGAAKGEVKRFRDRLAAPGPDGKVPDKPLARVGLGRTSLDVRTAELVIRDMARQSEELAKESLLTAPDRIRLRAQCSYGAHMCLTALRSIADHSSSSVHLLSNPMQRALRDVTMIASHATLEINSSLEEYGREMLGLPSSWWLA
jgi:3-hydroxy-9,10-secoandrosta-1,3,5(10)-triene-9,17-dione monooxygenase